MIHSFSVKNFQSVNDEVRIDFAVDEKTPESNRYARSNMGAKISLVQALVGPNASGKTTALRALTFIKWLTINSFLLNRHEEELPFSKFAGNKGNRTPTDLSVEFEMADGIYTYSLSMTKKQILLEELSIRSLSTARVTTKKLFTRRWDKKSKEYNLEDNGFNLPDGYWRSKSLGASTIISAASKYGHEYANRITDYWTKLETNVDDYRYYYRYSHDLWDALRYFGGDESRKKRVESEVRKYADFGINSFAANGKIQHKYGDVEFELDADEESSGTRNFMRISKMIDVVLRDGGIAVIDEFDAYLHANMFASLLEKFYSVDNKGKGQLLITTHNLKVFELVDPKYQLYLTEKDGRGATQLKRIRGRADANHLQRYLEGLYGALPDIRE